MEMLQSQVEQLINEYESKKDLNGVLQKAYSIGFLDGRLPKWDDGKMTVNKKENGFFEIQWEENPGEQEF